MGKRQVPGLNSSSTADIAFILLIFFLITTSMDTDRGLAVRLPNPPEENQQDPPKIRERNSMVVYVNMNNQIMVTVKKKSQECEISEIREIAKEFIANPNNDPDTRRIARTFRCAECYKEPCNLFPDRPCYKLRYVFSG